MILTTLKDYAKQKGITRARAYQLQSKLSLIDLPVYAIAEDGTRIPLYKDGEPLMQTYVQQERAQLQQELSMLNSLYVTAFMEHNVSKVNRINSMMQAIESILK